MKEVKIVISRVVNGAVSYIWELEMIVTTTDNIERATVFNCEDDARSFMQKHTLMNWNITPHYVTQNP